MLKNLFIFILVVAFCAAGFFMFIAYKVTHNHSISFSMRNGEESFEVNANYPRKHARQVEQFLHENLQAAHQQMTFELNGNIRTADKMELSIYSRPGKLNIKLDKRVNSEEAYLRAKRICDDLKVRLETY